jgi:UbiD family decarboxylase
VAPVNLDLRPWLDAARDAGELAEIDDASLDLEVGAITDINSAERGPALLFSGFEGGRVLSCSLSRAKRLALALGLDPDLDDQGIVRALERKPAEWRENAARFPHRVVADGPVREQILSGDEIDMTRYPAPLWHEGDGGRYLGTGCSVITRDTESDWVNAGTYRVAVHEEKLLGLMAQRSQHGAIHMSRYHERGEPAPVVVSFGHHPLLYVASGMSAPYGVSELDYVGAIAGEAVEVIEGEVTGLPIPAASELAIEGYVYPDELRLEGPFGEFTGYFAGGRLPRAVIHVERVYQRSNPVVYGSLPAKPPFDHVYWRAVLQSAMLMDGLRAAGVPEVTGVWQHEAGCALFFTVVSIKQRYAGHARQVGLAAASSSASLVNGRYVIVVDDDVDVTNLEEVLWVMSTRSDPIRSINVVEQTHTTPLDPMLLDPESTPWVTSRAIIDACRPFDRRGDFPDVVEVSPGLAEQVDRDWGAALGWR